MRLLLLFLPTLLLAFNQLTLLDEQTQTPLAQAKVITPQGVLTSDTNGHVWLDEAIHDVRVKALGYRPLQVSVKAKTTTARLRPITVKALYLSFWGASPESTRLHEILELAKETEINAVVVDVKNEFGLTSYKTGVKEAAKIVAHRNRTIRDIASFMQVLREHDMYTIGRIVVFKDGLRAEKHPEVAVKDLNGSRWVNKEGLSWLDPFLPSNQDYNIAIAEDAAKIGFDEINFDYIRFPEKRELKFAKESFLDNRVAAVSTFLRRAKERLQPYGVFISVDTFGQVAWDPGDTGIGQTVISMRDHVDYFSPMLYPSGFAKGTLGLKDPTSDVYKIIRSSLENFDVAPIRVRPWLQAFKDYAHSRTFFNPKKIREQIMATEGHGSGGWLLWNPSSRYKKATFKNADESDSVNLAQYEDEPHTIYTN